ncbi:MAG: hypothetical protein ACK5JT_02340 [Hyphomicrobiaceae bacterium]
MQHHAGPQPAYPSECAGTRVLETDLPRYLESRNIPADPHDPGVWRPVEKTRVFFMRVLEHCPACRVLHSNTTSLPSGLLHVVLSNDRLIVTEADDLHQPGRVLSGVVVVDNARLSIFKLSSEPPPGLDPGRHLPATGVATMTWGGTGTKRLQISGLAGRDPTCKVDILEAVECSPD